MKSIISDTQIPFTIDPSITAEEESERVALIRYALENDQVIPHYQGLYNNEISKIDKYEALMRLRGPDGTIHSPRHFMPFAKKHGLYLDLNLAMFNRVFADFSLIDCPVSLNLSPYHLNSPAFCQLILDKLVAFYKPSNIILEILEDECTIDSDILMPFIDKARSYGAKIAIDDFGTGYSNLISILKLDPDFLKIDGEITKDVERCYVNEVLMETAATMGHKLNIPLVAEYVENEDIQKVVERYGILYSQGFHFSRPQAFSAVYNAEKKV